MSQIKNRRGYSLIELMVSISVTGVLLVVTAGWIHQTMKCSSRIKQRQRHHQNMTRLSGNFRDHVHECETIAMDGVDRLALTWEDGTRATYTITNNTLQFEKNEPPTTSDEPRTKREKYVLSPNSTVEWDTSEMPGWISLIVSRRREVSASNNLDHSMPVDLHVRVAPNRWGRWSADSATENGSEGSK